MITQFLSSLLLIICISVSLTKPSMQPLTHKAQFMHDAIFPPPGGPRGADTLPSLPLLHQSIDSFYAAQTNAQLLEYRESKKGEWLKYLPNLGITYTITGQPRPSLSISSGILYQAQKTKQARADKRRQIIETNRVEAEQVKAKLKELLLRYELLTEALAHQRSLHQIDVQLFAIREDEYLRQERAPSDFLQAKRTFLLQQEALHQKEGQLQLLKLEILTTAHYQ